MSGQRNDKRVREGERLYEGEQEKGQRKISKQESDRKGRERKGRGGESEGRGERYLTENFHLTENT